MTDAATETETENAPPEIVGWEAKPPPSVRASKWDDVVEVVRERDDYMWAKVKRPTSWHSSSASSFRKRHPDLQLYLVTPQPGRGNKASQYVWIRRKPPEGEEDTGLPE